MATVRESVDSVRLLRLFRPVGLSRGILRSVSSTSRHILPSFSNRALTSISYWIINYVTHVGGGEGSSKDDVSSPEGKKPEND